MSCRGLLPKTVRFSGHFGDGIEDYKKHLWMLHMVVLLDGSHFLHPPMTSCRGLLPTSYPFSFTSESAFSHMLTANANRL